MSTSTNKLSNVYKYINQNPERFNINCWNGDKPMNKNWLEKLKLWFLNGFFWILRCDK